MLIGHFVQGVSDQPLNLRGSAVVLRHRLHVLAFDLKQRPLRIQHIQKRGLTLVVGLLDRVVGGPRSGQCFLAKRGHLLIGILQALILLAEHRPQVHTGLPTLLPCFRNAESSLKDVALIAIEYRQRCAN